MKDKGRIDRVEAVLRETRVGRGDVAPPKNFRSEVMSRLRETEAPAVLEFPAPDATLWTFARVAAAAALIAIVFGALYFGSGDTFSWVWTDDPLGFTSVMMNLI